jgi:hypothetical protein
VNPGHREAFAKAMQLLAEHGRSSEVTWNEFELWLDSPTPYSDVSSETLMKDMLLVAHEIVEIAELKRMDQEITPTLLTREPGLVYKAHLSAYEAELTLAEETNDLEHVTKRLKDVQSWVNDSNLPRELRPKCETLLARTKNACGQNQNRA